MEVEPGFVLRVDFSCLLEWNGGEAWYFINVMYYFHHDCLKFLQLYFPKVGDQVSLPYNCGFEYPYGVG